MHHPFNYHAGERDPQGGTLGWRLFALLVFVVAALLALVLIPLLMRERTAELRRELFEVTTPLAERWSDFVRTAAVKESAIRRYAHTGEEAYLERFRVAHAEAGQAASQLQILSRRLGDDEVAGEAHALLGTWKEWTEQSLAFAEGALSRGEYQELLPIQRARYGALLDAERRFDRALYRAIQARQAALQQVENQWVYLTAGLAFMAAIAVGAVLWLGRRLREYAREQSRFLRITQLLNEASNLDEALQHIARGVIQLTEARGAHVERINGDRNEVEVVSTVGSGVPSLGSAAPYSGSLAEKVVASGEPEVVTLRASAEHDRAMAPHLIASCPNCYLLAVPLFSEDAPLGILLLNRPATHAPFKAEEVTRIRVLADMATLVLQRLSLLEEMRRSERALRQRTDELRELNETLEQRVAQRTARIQELASQLTMAEQKERRRISQVLHDDLQQQLYGIQLRLAVLRHRASDETHAKLLEEIAQAEAWIKDAIATTRRLSVDLSPPVLTQAGFVEALEWLKSQMKELHGLAVEVRAQPDLRIPNQDMQVFLFQVVRELLFNVVKHAGTRSATVSIEDSDGFFIIHVADKGRGFDPGDANRHGQDVGLGLTAARERLALFGGDLTIASAPGEGTRVTLRCPLDQGQHVRAANHIPSA